MTREEVHTKSWWHTDPWESRRGEKNGWHGESTGNLHESCAWRTHGSNRQGHTKSLNDLEALVQGMHDGLVALAARMQQTEDALLTAKEEACVAKERIVNLEAQVQALQWATRGVPQPAGVARDAPHLAGVGGPSLAASGSHHPHAELSEAAPHPPPCDQWHEHRPHANHIDVSNGEAEGKVHDWLDHLRNTLFEDDSRVLDQLEDKIKCNWPYMKVLTCKTKANRFLYVCCIKCGQFSYGDYGNWEISKNPEAPQRARDDLAKFFKLEVTSDGGRIV